MGKILRRYLLGETLASFLVGLGAFAFLLFIARVLELVDLVLSRGVAWTQVLGLFALIVPAFLEIAIPVAALLGVVAAFSRLAADGELLAMRAGGLSVAQLARPIALFAGAAAVITLLAAGWARPWAERRISKTVYEIATSHVAAALRPRLFHTLIDGVIVYVERIDRETGALEGIVVSDERTPTRHTTVFAESARIAADGAGAGRGIRLVLRNGTAVTRMQHDADSYDTTAFESFELDLDIAAHVAAAGGTGEGPPPEHLYPRELWARAHAASTTSAAATAATLELHRRAAFAVAAALFALLGLPLGLQPTRVVRMRALGLTLTSVLAYHVILTASFGLSRRGVVPPALAPWLANMSATAALLVLYARADTGRVSRSLRLRRQRLAAAPAAT